ncbi:hypothetical protein F5148DRAFT_1146980 [Russula earlei]|uniref:Uncharacterized protein n=1 Tax=Russula earlei TaxID=71964 RepID=A0ACC0UJJ5_9AGAM|nr:hypothetical protein F5148DRAFT_1146980 [Russula earlei]
MCITTGNLLVHADGSPCGVIAQMMGGHRRRADGGHKGSSELEPNIVTDSFRRAPLEERGAYRAKGFGCATTRNPKIVEYFLQSFAHHVTGASCPHYVRAASLIGGGKNANKTSFFVHAGTIALIEGPRREATRSCPLATAHRRRGTAEAGLHTPSSDEDENKRDVRGALAPHSSVQRAVLLGFFKEKKKKTERRTLQGVENEEVEK